MADRRTLTGTKTLQLAWSALALLALGAAALLWPRATEPVPLVAGGAVWLLGLLVLGWRERRAWNRLVANSTFERQAPGRMADLQRIVKGHTVTVATAVPGLLTQTHTVVAASIDGVDADFEIVLDHVGGGAADEGVTTGNEALDERWHIQGSTRNVSLLLSADVQSRLMDVTVPATVTVTPARVEVEVPFTRLSPDELATLAGLAGTIAEQVERQGRTPSSPTG